MRKRGDWTRKLKAGRAGAMLRDIFEAKHDLAGLAEAYGLDPADLASWANDEHNRTVLQGLCVLADLQTQLMLSRYRQLAVTELIRQANGGTDEHGQPTVSAEQARKACVDLLRADLKPVSPQTRSTKDAGQDNETPTDDLQHLRAAMFAACGTVDRNENTSDPKVERDRVG